MQRRNFSNNCINLKNIKTVKELFEKHPLNNNNHSPRLMKSMSYEPYD